MVASALHCTVMVHRIKVKYLKRTIWRIYGNCPAFSYAKITITVCADDSVFFSYSIPLPELECEHFYLACSKFVGGYFANWRIQVWAQVLSAVAAIHHIIREAMFCPAYGSMAWTYWLFVMVLNLLSSMPLKRDQWLLKWTLIGWFALAQVLLKFYLLHPFCSPIFRTYHSSELILILYIWNSIFHSFNHSAIQDTAWAIPAPAIVLVMKFKEFVNLAIQSIYSRNVLWAQIWLRLMKSKRLTMKSRKRWTLQRNSVKRIKKLLSMNSIRMSIQSLWNQKFVDFSQTDCMHIRLWTRLWTNDLDSGKNNVYEID